MRSTLRTLPLLLPFLFVLSACSGGDEASTGGGPAQFAAITPSVEVVRARFGALPLQERMSGMVEARNQVQIYSEITAPVVRVAVQNGDFVNQGDALVYLRDKQYQDQVNQSEAALQIAEADAKRTQAALDEVKNREARTKQLADRQLESQQQLEMIQAQVASAEAAHAQAVARISQADANLEEQREMLRRTVVRAPVSGYVGQRNAEVGMRVDQGSPLFVLGNFQNVRVKVSVTDRMINKINVGQTALITLENENMAPLQAEVSRISPFLEAGSYSAEAEIDVDNTEGILRPGMFVTVDVLYGESSSAVIIPEASLYENPANGMLGVYVAPSLSSETPVEEPDSYDPDNLPPLTDATQMVFKPVDVIARGRGVAAVSGIQMGDWVVSVGQNMIRSVADRTEAKARPMSWERIAQLQSLQDQDLLIEFMAKQQRMAREMFTEESDSVGGEPSSQVPATELVGSTEASPTTTVALDTQTDAPSIEGE